MLDVLNLLYLGAVVASPALYMGFSEEVPAPALHEIRTVTATRTPSRETCKNHGVIVAYERDWTEERQIGDGQVTVIPPAPGEIEGYAFLFNRRTCIDKPPAQTNYLVWGDYSPTWSAKMFGWKGWNNGQHPPALYDAGTTPPEQMPRWLPQVLRVLESKAKTEPALAEFIANMPTTPVKFDREGWHR